MATIQTVLLSFVLGYYCYNRALAVTVTTNNDNVEAKENEEAVLSCVYQVQTDPNPRVEWKKIVKDEVSFVYYGGVLMERYVSRAKMEGASIRFQNLTRADTGEYRCEVTARMDTNVLGEVRVMLTVLVPPALPMCGIPSSVMTGRVVELTCQEKEGSPLSKYHWYKDGILLPEKSADDPQFKNTSFTMNTTSGTLQFNPVSKGDSGDYSCDARNKVGLSQKCSGKYMQVDNLNVSAIIIAVVVVAMVIAVCGLGVCYAQRQGYFSKGRHSVQKSTSEYRAAPEDENFQNFQHKKSFVI